MPRPIAWVTSLGEDGLVNLAPFTTEPLAARGPTSGARSSDTMT
ncbi:MAG: hypothetical protein ABI699_00480 [Caldimonas sp.]